MKRIVIQILLLTILCAVAIAQNNNIPVKKDTTVWVKKEIQMNFIQSKFRELDNMQLKLDGKKKEVDAEQKAIDGTRRYLEGQLDLLNLMADSVLVEKRKIE